MGTFVKRFPRVVSTVRKDILIAVRAEIYNRRNEKQKQALTELHEAWTHGGLDKLAAVLGVDPDDVIMSSVPPERAGGAAAISETDSVFTCRPMRIAASWTGGTLPSITWRIRSTISS